MHAEDWDIDPELNAMLREVAADPRATLLRIARPPAIRAVFASSVAASQCATGLLPVERELLRVHREELARLLRRACVMLIFESPAGRRYSMRPVTDALRHDPPTQAQWVADAQREVEVSKADVGHEVLALLQRCVADVAAGRASITQLAAASSRLQPTTQAEVYRGEELAIAGRHDAAIEVFESVLARRAASALRAIAWTNIGKSRFEQGAWEPAWSAFEAAVSIDERRAPAAINSLVAALLMGNMGAAQRAASVLDERFELSNERVTEFVTERAPLGGAAAEAIRAGLESFAAHESRLGATSRRIFDALA